MPGSLLSLIAAMLICCSANSQSLKAVSVNLFGYITENNNERSLRDGVAVIFNGQSDAVDLSDAKKLSNPAENIAILRQQVLLAAEQRTTYDTIPITLWNLQQRAYELEIFTKNIDTLYLEDVKTHAKTVLHTATDTIKYSFTSLQANTAKDSVISFWLIFDTVAAVTPPAPHHCGQGQHHPRKRAHHHQLNVFPNPSTGGYIHLEMQEMAAGTCKVSFFGLGHISSYSFKHGDSCNERINTANLPKGKYYFIIEDEEGWKEARQIEIY